MSQLFSKSHKGIGMNGPIATWYTRITEQNSREYRNCARRVSTFLREGARVLEIAFGPGYGAIELSELGRYALTGVDISDTFVRIAAEKARRAEARIDFRQGDAQALPFQAGSFDLTYCHAAFKNFTRPVKAIEEMYRVLAPGGVALIFDLRPDLTDADIAACTGQMGLGKVDAFFTRWTFKHMLTRLAHSEHELHRMAASTSFGGCEVNRDGPAYEVVLRKPARA